MIALCGQVNKFGDVGAINNILIISRHNGYERTGRTWNCGWDDSAIDGKSHAMNGNIAAMRNYEDMEDMERTDLSEGGYLPSFIERRLHDT